MYRPDIGTRLVGESFCGFVKAYRVDRLASGSSILTQFGVLSVSNGEFLFVVSLYRLPSSNERPTTSLSEAASSVSFYYLTLGDDFNLPGALPSSYVRKESADYDALR